MEATNEEEQLEQEAQMRQAVIDEVDLIMLAKEVTAHDEDKFRMTGARYLLTYSALELGMLTTTMIKSQIEVPLILLNTFSTSCAHRRLLFPTSSAKGFLCNSSTSSSA